VSFPTTSDGSVGEVAEARDWTWNSVDSVDTASAAVKTVEASHLDCGALPRFSELHQLRTDKRASLVLFPAYTLITQHFYLHRVGAPFVGRGGDHIAIALERR